MRIFTITIVTAVLVCGAASFEAVAQNGRGPGWGGPGRGPGFGQGRGPGFGRGQVQNVDPDAVTQNVGPRRGPGAGRGPGVGCPQGANCPWNGAGCGPGCPRGQGRPGAGRGAGLGPGPGRGQGRGVAGARQFCPAANGESCVQLLAEQIESMPKGELTDQDREGLALMRETEKLAHDVYVTLHEAWNIPPFANIPRAESQHMDVVKTLLDRYEIDDPMTDTTVGVFQNQEIQELYDKLVAQGKPTVVDAAKVGALVEELDIAELQELIKDAKSEDLRLVYESLLQGSRNHLRAFARQLKRHNATYEASHLSQEEFDRIAASDHEPGALRAKTIQ